MAIHGYTRLYMTIYGCTWLYTAMHGNTWLYTAIHGNTWLYTAIYDNIWLYMAIHGYAWQYMAIHGYTWQYMAKHGYTWQYMAMHGYTWLNTAIHGKTWLYTAIQLIGKETGSTKIIELKNDSGLNLTEPGDVANSLNSYFTAIGPKLASEFFSGANNIVHEDYLTKIKSSFTLEEVKPAIVLELLNAVKISKATGTGGDNSNKRCFGTKPNCSGNLDIPPGIGTLGNFSGKHAIIPGHCRKKSGHRRKLYFTFLFRLTSVS